MVNKNKNKFDVNTMDIKSHLDASFEIDNIKVSEELIAKTLLAVKASENETTKSTDRVQEDLMDSVENSNADNVINIERKRGKFRFLPMKLATVAAAVFVFVVGIYAMNNGIGASKKDSGSNNSLMNESSSTSMDSGNDNVAEDKMEISNARVEGVNDEENGVAEKKLDESTSYDKSDELAEPEYNITGDFSKSSVSNPIIISNLYPIHNITISEFTIKDANNKLLYTTKQIEKVIKVYDILDGYPLTMVENKTLDYIYQFDILTDDGQSYTILIGNGIYLKTTDELEYTYYEVDNSNELLDKLKDFISTMP